MFRLVIPLALVSPASAEEAAGGTAKAQIPAISLLPNGSQLKGVMLPRYNDQHQLVGVLKAELLTLVAGGQVDGSQITIEFFNPDQSPRARIDLVRASFDQEKGLVSTDEPVQIQSEQMTAHGSGLRYSVTSGQVFLCGPVKTVLKLSPKKP